MNKILITGAAGFLGSHLAYRYLDAGFNVLGIDNFSTALGRTAPHFLKLKSSTNYSHYTLDICNKTSIENLITGYKPNIILNFACPASPPKYQAMPIETMLTCVEGVNNILKAAKSIKATVIHASTSEIYGDPQISPQPESYRGWVNSYGPRSCYDEGKRAAEALCYDYMNMGVDIRIVRIFNTYGPHMDPEDGRVVSNFICQALDKKPLTIYGSGKQTRSFCYVDDLIDAIIKVAALSPNELKAPVNIGNPIEFTIQDLAKFVIKEIGENSIQYLDLPKDDPKQRKPDLTFAKSILNWEPKISIQDGLKPTINWFKYLLKNKS